LSWFYRQGKGAKLLYYHKIILPIQLKTNRTLLYTDRSLSDIRKVNYA